MLLSFKYWVLSIPTYMALFSLGIQIYKRNSYSPEPDRRARNQRKNPRTQACIDQQPTPKPDRNSTKSITL